MRSSPFLNLYQDKHTYFDDSISQPSLRGADEEDREKTRPKFIPPRVGGLKDEDAFQQGFRDALKELEREALWQSNEKGGGAGKFKNKFLRIQRIRAKNFVKAKILARRSLCLAFSKI